MKAKAQIGKLGLIAGLLLAFSVPISMAQRGQRSAPQPSRPQTSRPAASRPQNFPHSQPRQEPRFASPSRPEMRSGPSSRIDNYRPPQQGHHFGQWLNQHRDQPLDQQRRALQNDPAFRRLPPQRQQEYVQRLQHFNSLPPDRQQQILRRGEVWEHLRPEQRQDFRNFARQYNGLPAERRQAVRNAIQALRAMPPQARQREIDSGRFGNFSPQERQMLNDAANLPLAPSRQNNAPSTGPGRYIPRPPQ